MSNQFELLEKYNLKPSKYTLKKNIKIIDTAQGRFLIKNKKRYDKSNLYRYLQSRGFNYFVCEYNDLDRDDYEIYPYIESIELSDEQKSIDLIYLMSLLHNKTTFYKNVDLDDVKLIYEKYTQQIIYLNSYYHDLQDIIETHTFMSPSEYLLIRNISKIYMILKFAKSELDSWYELTIKKKKIRKAMIHNNLTLDHLIESDNPYLISWDNAKMDNPIYDFIFFYKSNFLKLNFDNLMAIYESKFPLLEEEKKLMFTLLSIPEKIEFSQNEFKNTVFVKRIISYIDCTNDFISKQHSAYSDN